MGAVKTELTAADVMTADPVTIEPSASIREFARVLDDNEISGVPVVDQQGTLVGIASKTDLIRQCVQGTVELPPGYLFDLLVEQEIPESAADTLPDPQVRVEDFMTEGPVTVSPQTPLNAVARAMTEPPFGMARPNRISARRQHRSTSGRGRSRSSRWICPCVASWMMQAAIAASVAVVPETNTRSSTQVRESKRYAPRV